METNTEQSAPNELALDSENQVAIQDNAEKENIALNSKSPVLIAITGLRNCK